MWGEMKKFSPSKIVFLHLVPGFCLTIGILIVNYLIPPNIVPNFLIFIICCICILVPVETGIIKYYKRNEESKKLIDLHEEKEKRNLKQTLIFSMISIFWAILVFTVFGSVVNTYIKETFFAWFPPILNLEQFAKISQSYSETILKITYFSGLLVIGVIIPIVEELYFRGFLLPRMGKGKYTVPFIESVLFAVYHFLSPWMIPIRIIAIFPMTFFVLQKKNIWIGIVTHVFLNIVGDYILVIPIIFN